MHGIHAAASPAVFKKLFKTNCSDTAQSQTMVVKEISHVFYSNTIVIPSPLFDTAFASVLHMGDNFY